MATRDQAHPVGQAHVDPSVGSINDDLTAGSTTGPCDELVRTKLIKFFNHLTANTDTFDKVMVQIERDLGDDHILPADLVAELVDEFLAT